MKFIKSELYTKVKKKKRRQRGKEGSDLLVKSTENLVSGFSQRPCVSITSVLCNCWKEKKKRMGKIRLRESID